MKLQEIADGINQHLKRFEKDTVINARDVKWKTVQYYHPRAYASGSRIMVSYVCFQGSSSLRKQEALDYLKWLDEGGVGTFWAFKRKDT